MSDAADRLARTRLAIIAHLQQHERHHERRENQEYEDAYAQQHEPQGGEQAWSGATRRPSRVAGWLGRMRQVLGSWWRHHPAHLGVELATPALSNYAGRKPAQYLAIAAALGVIVVLIRPWRLVSVTGLIVALAKSSQLSSLVLSALSGGGDESDHRLPG